MHNLLYLCYVLRALISSLVIWFCTQALWASFCFRFVTIPSLCNFPPPDLPIWLRSKYNASTISYLLFSTLRSKQTAFHVIKFVHMQPFFGLFYLNWALFGLIALVWYKTDGFGWRKYTRTADYSIWMVHIWSCCLLIGACCTILSSVCTCVIHITKQQKKKRRFWFGASKMTYNCVSYPNFSMNWQWSI